MRTTKHPGIEAVIQNIWAAPVAPHVVDAQWDSVTPNGPTLVLTLTAPTEWGRYVSWRQLRGDWFAMVLEADPCKFLAVVDGEMDTLLRLHLTPENRMAVWASLLPETDAGTYLS